ncbi:MAG: membrane protein insertase YidC [Aerococcus sp.]|nr:membrane protein insertase YidC [Aerococcus sp.]
MNNHQSRKRWLLLGLGLVLVLVLTGCASNGSGALFSPINENSTGFWDRIILYNLSQIIIYLSNLFGGNYAVGIILFTIIIRAVLIPLYQFQQNSTTRMQEMQPEMQALREKYASKDPESQQKLEEETAKLQEKYDYNPWIGCLPLIIQLPILTAVYQAIIRTPELRQGHLLWMNLGNADPYFILPLLAAIFMWYNSYLMQVASGQKGGMSVAMQWVMPIMIFIIVMQLPAAISLYMVTTNLFSVVQTLAINNPYRQQQERQEKAAHERELNRRLEKARRNPRGKKHK